eukprot:s2371_g9.t1
MTSRSDRLYESANPYISPLFSGPAVAQLFFKVPTDWGHLTYNVDVSVSISRECVPESGWDEDAKSLPASPFAKPRFSWEAEETDSRVINSLHI